MILMGLISILLIAGMVAWLSESINENAPKWIAALGLVAACLPLRHVLSNLDLANSQPWLVNEIFSWIPRFNINVHFALDGLSLLLVLLTLSMGLVAVLAAWKEIKHRAGFFYFNLLCTC